MARGGCFYDEDYNDALVETEDDLESQSYYGQSYYGQSYGQSYYGNDSYAGGSLLSLGLTPQTTAPLADLPEHPELPPASRTLNPFASQVVAPARPPAPTAPAAHGTSALTELLSSGNTTCEGSPAGPISPTGTDTGADAATTHTETEAIDEIELPAEFTKPLDRSAETIVDATEAAAKARVLTIMTAGHVDSGKSTLTGRLVQLGGRVTEHELRTLGKAATRIGKASFVHAWLLDQDEAERTSGMTLDVSHTRFRTPSGVMVTALDCPGHADLVPQLLQAAGAPDAALLVVDATPGSFEAGFALGGQTREHALLIRAMSVPKLIVAVNKMDAAPDPEVRFNEIRATLGPYLRKACSFEEDMVTYVPIAAFDNTNVAQPAPEVLPWYRGPTLVRAIEDLAAERATPEALAEAPRFVVDDVTPGYDCHAIVYGAPACGFVMPGDRLVSRPATVALVVKSVSAFGESIDFALPGTPAALHCNVVGSSRDEALAALNVSGAVLAPGADLMDESRRVVVRVSVLEPRAPLMRGSELDAFVGNRRVAATVRKIESCATVAGDVPRPRFMPQHSRGVIWLELSSAIPVMPYAAPGGRALGRVVLREEGLTSAVGVIERVVGAKSAN